MSAWLLALASACGENPYGINSETPLGEFEKLDSVLRAKKLVKESKAIHLRTMDRDPETEPEGFDVANGKRYSYTDNARVADIHTAYVYVDGSGKVAGVGAEFRSDGRTFDFGVYKVTRFIADVWVTAAGGLPVFKEQSMRPGMIGKEMLEARFNAGRVAGLWTKQVLDGGIRERIVDHVLIWFH